MLVVDCKEAAALVRDAEAIAFVGTVGIWLLHNTRRQTCLDTRTSFVLRQRACL